MADDPGSSRLPDTLPGLTWAQAQTLIYNRARHWYKIYQDGQDFDDFVFAGWYALALALRSFVPDGPATFHTYLGTRCDGVMQDQRRAWMHTRRSTGTKTWPLVVWQSWETVQDFERLLQVTQRMPRAYQSDRRQEIRDTEARLPRRLAALLGRLCAGESQAAIARDWGMTQGYVSQLTRELRGAFAEYL